MSKTKLQSNKETPSPQDYQQIHHDTLEHHKMLLEQNAVVAKNENDNYESSNAVPVDASKVLDTAVAESMNEVLPVPASIEASMPVTTPMDSWVDGVTQIWQLQQDMAQRITQAWISMIFPGALSYWFGMRK